MAGLADPVHERLAHDLYELLVARPEQNKRQLLASLQSKGWTGLTGTAINSALYAVSRPFAHDSTTPPRWRTVGPPKGSVVTASSRPAGVRLRIQISGRTPRSSTRSST